MGRTLQLYQLQSLDSDIDKTNQQLAEIAQQLGESDALKKARAAVDAAEQNLRKAQASMKDLDLEVKSLANKIAAEEGKLYGGKVLNAKEAANLQDEVASLKRRHSEREERLLEAMMLTEESEETLAQTQANLARLQQEWAAGQQELLQTKQMLETRLSELQERRPALASPVTKEDLNEYESLRAKKAGRGIVAVKNGVCQGCGMTLSQNRVRQARAETELVHCSTCGRILYAP